MEHKIERKGGKVMINGKIVFDFRKETNDTVTGAAEKIAKRLAKILKTQE